MFGSLKQISIGLEVLSATAERYIKL